MKIIVNEYDDDNREVECSQMEVWRQFKLFFEGEKNVRILTVWLYKHSRQLLFVLILELSF